MRTTLREHLLSQPGCRDHIAHLYTDVEGLCEGLQLFVEAAIDRGQAVAVIARPQVLELLHQRLSNVSLHVDHLMRSGQLTFRNAVALLPQIIRRDDTPDREAFDRLLHEVLASAAGFTGLAMYGEMVDLLRESGRRDAYTQLEHWWNDAVQQHGFALMCGYYVNVFDSTVQTDLQAICDTHTHLIPECDIDAYEFAVESALQQVIPHCNVNGIRQALIERCHRKPHMPASQAALFGLDELLPSLAQDVRIEAADIYQRRKHICSSQPCGCS